ncbi:HEPN domain-containing protein [Pseudoalteromonas sp. MMG024]|uniref:HEPN domain-containing protein n=1 Tax=Pseudoalteromonas sp. MMG024 TaxID=2909980 RepID=UPI001EEECC7D|nr:hypothetical protein [Pseudoalteromonas sp. MMG024]
MSNSFKSFQFAISDAEDLLHCYDILNNSQEHTGSDALKRSALIMTLTAWETYVEDVITEIFENKFGALHGSQIGSFMDRQLELRLKTFHNPNSSKTKQIFEEFFGYDITQDWSWNNYLPKQSRETLNKWINKRGYAVHRAVTESNKPHIIKRDELQKCIRFFKDLVAATDKAVEKI